MSGVKRQVSIAIMGATGSGKTTFINKASGSSLKVGTGLESCTGRVEQSPTFELGGYQVTLIDTPGFDDSSRSDMDVLKAISSFLAQEYNRKKKLSGVLYLHRISDVRMGSISRRSFRPQGFPGVVRGRHAGEWGHSHEHAGADCTEGSTITRGAVDEQRSFFKAAIEKGAQMVRHDNTPEMAREILRRLVEKEPIPLKIQVEMGKEGRDVSQTASAEKVDENMYTEIRKHQDAIIALKADMKANIRSVSRD